MSTGEWIFEELDLIGRRLWEISLDSSAFNTLKKKTSRLSAQIAVHQALENAASQLLEPQGSRPLPNTQGRLSKFLDTLYGSTDNTGTTTESRWQKIRSLDCATFLFIAVSYTPLEISKMHRTEFEYLIENAQKYLQVKSLPPRWMFRREIQMALAGKAELENIAQFKKGVSCRVRRRK